MNVSRVIIESCERPKDRQKEWCFGIEPYPIYCMLVKLVLTVRCQILLERMTFWMSRLSPLLETGIRHATAAPRLGHVSYARL